MTQTPLKRPQRMPNSGQPQAQSPPDSTSSTAIELLQTALQHANQAEVADFAQLLQDHQTHQRQTAQQIAHYLRPALGGQSLAQMVLDELAGTVERPQRCRLKRNRWRCRSCQITSCFDSITRGIHSHRYRRRIRQERLAPFPDLRYSRCWFPWFRLWAFSLSVCWRRCRRLMKNAELPMRSKNSFLVLCPCFIGAVPFVQRLISYE